jgi:hypothetical protein
MVAGVQRTAYRSPAEKAGISRRQRYEMFKSDLFRELQTHKAHLMDCADYIKPRRPRWFVTDKNRGDRRNQKIIDSTATFASRTLQSGMHAGMTNPARPWLKLLSPDDDLNEYEPVKEWLHTVTRRMLTIFARTNLYNMLPIHYGDMGVFGTAATSILNDDEDIFRSYNYPIGSYAIGSNHRGIVDRFAHETEMTVAQVVEEYLLDRKSNMIDWTNASNAIKNCWDRCAYNDKVQVCWLVTPNYDRESDQIEAYRSAPFYGAHVEVGQERDDTFLRQEGFMEFPVLVSRWDVTGNDDWGTDCPGMVALGDIKQLQTGERRGGQALEKMVNPPVQAPSHVRNQKASLLPGDITYVDIREGQKGIHPIHEVELAFDKLEIKQEGVRNRIRKAFYEDLFLMLAYSDPSRGVQPPTATEIVERKEEKLIALGPVLERTNDELLDPLVDRVYAMMERNGLVPEPPEELRRLPLKVEFISILAQAQKLVGVVGHERFLQTATALITQGITEVKHKVDWMQGIDDLGDMLGINPKMLVPDDKAREAFAAEQKMAAQMAQAQSAKDGTAALKNVATSPVTDDNALGRLMSISQGQQ